MECPAVDANHGATRIIAINEVTPCSDVQGWAAGRWPQMRQSTRNRLGDDLEANRKAGMNEGGQLE